MAKGTIPPARGSQRTRATYSDPAIRGQLRDWKAQLAKDYRRFDRAFPTGANADLIAQFVSKTSTVGRRRALDKLARAFGPGVTLEGVRLDGEVLAVWSILKPRDSVTFDAAPETGLMQDCVTVNYVLAGVLPDGLHRLAEGAWTLEVPDHALGRTMARSGMLPTAIIREAHHNLLQLRSELVIPNGHLSSKHQFLVKAGNGGFVCALHSGPDISLQGRLIIYVRAETWISDDMIRDNQTLLVDDGSPGSRLGDSWLQPPPLRRLVDIGGGAFAVEVAQPGMPGLLARPVGRA